MNTGINSKALLLVIAVVLIGILAVMVMNANKKTPAEKVSNSISKAIDNASKK